MNSIRDRLESRRTPRLQTSSVDSGDSRMQSSLHNGEVPWLLVATSMRDVAGVAPTRKCHATNAGGKMKLLVINQKRKCLQRSPWIDCDSPITYWPNIFRFQMRPAKSCWYSMRSLTTMSFHGKWVRQLWFVNVYANTISCMIVQSITTLTW